MGVWSGVISGREPGLSGGISGRDLGVGSGLV